MSIEALILAKLHGKPEQRTGKTGRPFVTAKARAAVADGDAVYLNVVAFSETAGAALLALDAGDAVALAGTLRAGAWIDRDGNARSSLDLVAAQVLTVYGLAKKRRASTPQVSMARTAARLTAGRTTPGCGVKRERRPRTNRAGPDAPLRHARPAWRRCRFLQAVR